MTDKWEENPKEIYYVNDVEVTEEDFYEAMEEVIKRERQEDALDDAAQMDEDELRQEYYRGLDQ
jgi:hypothetical protein